MAAMKVEPVTYSMGEKAFLGALVHDEAVRERRPAVLMAPNWIGSRRMPRSRGRSCWPRTATWCSSSTCTGRGTRPEDFGEAAALANPLREDRSRRGGACGRPTMP